MSDDFDDNILFDDFDDDPDDNTTLEAYAEELTAAVEAFGVEIIEPGETR